MKTASRVYTALIFIFLFAPIAILLIFSFNEAKSLSVFSGFSLKWYRELLHDQSTLDSVRNTLLLAVSAMVISTVMGTAASVGIDRLRLRWLRATLNTVTDIPMTNPDIVTGVSLALLFAFTGTALRLNSVLGFWTLLIAHITFNFPYVILNVMPKLQQMDPELVDAALDLGCSPMKAFTKVVIHEIMPGVLSGALMAFTMSLDDFVISYFVTGSSFITLPVEIYNYTKKPIQPKIYALFTLMFAVILLLMVLMNLLQARSDKAKGRAAARRVRV